MLPSFVLSDGIDPVRVVFPGLRGCRGCRGGPAAGGTGAGGDSDLARMTLAGSIGTRFVARLYSEGPLR